TIILLAWSLAFRPGKRLADAALGLALVGLFVGTIAAAIQWYPLGASGAAYNPSDTIWELAKVGVLVLALAVLVVLRPADWGLAFGLFAVLLAGVGYHLLNPIPGDSYPAAERIAELAALPLFTVILYRHALGAPLIAPPTPARAAFTASAPAAVSEPIKIALTPQAASALAVMGATGDGQALNVKITRGVGKTLLADLTLLFTPPAPNGTITCVGAYDLIREISLTGFSLPISKINVIVSAINRARPARLRMPEHQSQLVHIARALGVTQIGPAVMTPLRTDDHNYGAIMVFSAFGQKEWTNDDHALLVALAEPIVNILISNENLNQLRANLQRQAAEAARRVEEAQTELRAAREKADRSASDLLAAQEESKRNRQQAESLTAIIQAGPAQDEQQQSAELAALQTNYRRALEELAALNDQLAAAQAEQAKLRETLEDSERARSQSDTSTMIGADLLPSDQELAAINRQLADAQTEIMLLRSQLAKGQTLQYDASPDETADELTALNEQWAVAQADLDQLRSQLRAGQSEADQARMTARTKEDEAAKLQAQLREAQSQIEKMRADLHAAGVEMAPAHPGADEQTQVAVMVSLAQDLRQPMSSIVGYTDLLMGESVGILGALQRTFLERIKASAQRMADILDDLIRLTAIDKGMLQLAHQSIEMTEVIEDAFTGLGIQFRERGVSLRMDIADDPLTLEADRDAIHQIISRLLANACAVSQPNSEVVLTARMQDTNFLLVSVRDSGGGIPPA
ncbi:MAG: histidine kinase dimerization/phospho-acceptor domain-containing protein, partial [Chloroflexota bacterium]